MTEPQNNFWADQIDQVQPLESDLKRRLRRYISRNPSLSDQEVSVAYLRILTRAQRDSFALVCISELVWDVRREKQREVERASQEQNRAIEEQALRDRNRQAEEALHAEYQRVFNDPVSVYAEGGSCCYDVVGNVGNRKAFQRWCGDSFDEWSERSCELIRNSNLSEKQKEDFYSDWHHGGVSDYYHRKHMSMVVGLINQVREDTRLRVTQELLESEFALGDGVRVTWGVATRDQHQQRIDLLAKNAAANVEAAARHQAAIDMLTEHEVTCLGELEPVDA